MLFSTLLRGRARICVYLLGLIEIAAPLSLRPPAAQIFVTHFTTILAGNMELAQIQCKTGLFT
jgi:hypothetical protein